MAGVGSSNAPEMDAVARVKVRLFRAHALEVPAWVGTFSSGCGPCNCSIAMGSHTTHLSRMLVSLVVTLQWVSRGVGSIQFLSPQLGHLFGRVAPILLYQGHPHLKQMLRCLFFCAVSSASRTVARRSPTLPVCRVKH